MTNKEFALEPQSSQCMWPNIIVPTSISGAVLNPTHFQHHALSIY
jgi:hypothetical protein